MKKSPLKSLVINPVLLQDSNIPARFCVTDISSYSGGEKALRQANRYIELFEKANKHALGLTFYGPSGSQKTALLAHIGKCLMTDKHGAHDVAYVKAREIADAILSRDSRFSFEELVAVDLVLIDNAEMFVDSKTEFPKTALLQLLQARLDDGKPFVIATRYTPDNWHHDLSESIANILTMDTISVMCERGPENAERFNVKSQLEVED
jgi:DNA replication protein DnaC